jgi:hypothetical protein
MTNYGLQTKFKARLKKKKADGTIIYHDNKILNFIFKKIDEKHQKKLMKELDERKV